jgi:hypothetical protein
VNIGNLTYKIGSRLIKVSGRGSDQFKDIRDDNFWRIYRKCKPFTMTSIERMYALYSAVNFIVRNNIPGDFVECGVWRGGSSMMIAEALAQVNSTDRKIFLYDTFEGMPDPTDADVDFIGNKADVLMEENVSNKETSVWCLAGRADVEQNLGRTEYPKEHLVFVEGKVEETIPAEIPTGQIALLRLDTDWYTSTKHELLHLFPKLTNHGVLIIDDYGHWQGCRQAVDEYFKEHDVRMLLQRIDYTGRLGIRTT